MDVLFRTALLSLILLLTGCSVNHTGLQPTIPGERFEVTCEYDYTYSLNSSSGMLNGRMTTQVCGNGVPASSELRAYCNSLAYVFQQDSAGLFDEITSVTTQRVGEPVPLPQSCNLSSEIPAGWIGGRTDELGSGAFLNESILLDDETGALIGDLSTSTLNGEVSNASIWVGAKFLKWRYAHTAGDGSVSFDGGDCPVNTQCEMVLRHVQLDVDDFTIVRPTAFARDISFRDVTLYSINNYRTQRRGNGSFELNGIQLMVSALQNGVRTNFLTTADVTVAGQLGQYLPGGSSAPQQITLRIQDSNEGFYINGAIEFQTTKTLARLKNHGTGRCLRGSATRAREIPATIESCTTKTQPQNVALETRGNAFRFRNSATDMCLNLKTSQQNVDGGTVAWVGCSNHVDQLWSVQSDGHVVHSGGGRCLNVHRGRENRNGGRVSVYSCADTPDQRWSVVAPQ